MALLTELESLSDTDPRDLGQAQLSVLRKLFESTDEGLGLFLFARTIFGYRDLTLNVHLPICRLLSRWGETVYTDGYSTTEVPNDFHIREHGEIAESYRRLMVCIPRDSYKTSLCTRANTVWQLARDPLHNLTFGIFNEKAELAEKWLTSIVEVIERSKLFHLLWPEMLPRGISYLDQEKGITRSRSVKWGGRGILFEREAAGASEYSIESHGIGGAVTGNHYTHKVLDDIIGLEASLSTPVMQSAIDWMAGSRPLEKPAEHGCELIAHTPWAYHDVYSWALQHWPGEYRVYRRHLLENELGEPDIHTGESILPHKFSTTAAKKLFDNKSKWFSNHAQYQCIPILNPDQTFDPDWIKYGQVIERGRTPVFSILPGHYDPSILDLECGDETAPMQVPLSWMSKCILLDPAPSKPTDLKKEPRAGNGIAVVGKDPWGRRYLLEARSERETPNRVFEILFELSDKWMTNLIGIEEVNFSAVYAPLFRELGQYKYPDWKPEFFPLTTKGWEKFDRIKKMLITPYENGFWYYNTKGTSKAVKEIIEFGTTGAPVDILDASSYTDQHLHRPDTPDETHQRYYRRHEQAASRGLTGYGQFMQEEHVR